MLTSAAVADRVTGTATVNPADMAARRLRNCLREEPVSLSGAEIGEAESLRLSLISGNSQLFDLLTIKLIEALCIAIG